MLSVLIIFPFIVSSVFVRASVHASPASRPKNRVNDDDMNRAIKKTLWIRVGKRDADEAVDPAAAGDPSAAAFDPLLLGHSENQLTVKRSGRTMYTRIGRNPSQVLSDI